MRIKIKNKKEQEKRINPMISFPKETGIFGLINRRFRANQTNNGKSFNFNADAEKIRRRC